MPKITHGSFIVRVESLFERDGEQVALQSEATDVFPHFYELRCGICASDLPVGWGPGVWPPTPRRELYKSVECYELAVQRSRSCASCGKCLEVPGG